MIIYPAIDIQGGQCVRLKQGDMAQATRYSASPAAQARRFAEAGADWVHVVDLDGAVAGRQVNAVAVEEILATGLKVQLGGGIRSRQQIDHWLDRGVARVVLGTLALNDPDTLKSAAGDYPDRIAVAADAKNGKLAAGGWLDESLVAPLELIRRFEDCRVAAVIFTDIARDGMLGGINTQATRELAQATSIPVIASGGLADSDELHTLASSTIAGVIIGRALYEGRIDLADAIAHTTKPAKHSEVAC